MIHPKGNRDNCPHMREGSVPSLRNCPGTQSDLDNAGIPCEWQWCGESALIGASVGYAATPMGVSYVRPQPTFVLPHPNLCIRVFASIRGRLFFLVVFVVPRQPGLDLHQAYVPSIRDDLANITPQRQMSSKDHLRFNSAAGLIADAISWKLKQ